MSDPHSGRAAVDGAARTYPRRLPIALLGLFLLGGLALGARATAASPAASTDPDTGTLEALASTDPLSQPPRPVMSDTGYVIDSDVVVSSCGSCHQRDESGRMGRISYLRKAPEGWERSVRRMVSLHGVELSPEAAREVVRYLSTAQGLAPEELRPGLFEVERTMEPFRFDHRPTEQTCTSCHSMGRIITQRRTAEEWQLLIMTHRALYPLVDRQVFFDSGGPGSDTDDDDRFAVERAIAHLSSVYPLETPEWQAWSANVRPARLEGTWALTGEQPGRGRVFGTVEIRPVPGSEDEFTTEARFVYADDGSSTTRTGRSVVYTGYQWRGRSSGGNGSDELREVMTVQRGWESISGRWFTGPHDEFGIDVDLRRVATGPLVTGVQPYALRLGGASQEIRIYGANLPTEVAPGAIDLGPGIEVEQVVSASPDVAVLRARVAPSARSGLRDAFVAGVTLTDALVVYERVAALKVAPDNGIARNGGVVVPKQYQQFEAIGYAAGADGAAGTDDDISLGPVPVTWSIEEYPVTYDDDDVLFVGEIDERGLFTPAVDGPNPERRGDRNNMGEVWVVATYDDPLDSASPTLTARGYLIVTAPLHLRWDEWPTN